MVLMIAWIQVYDKNYVASKPITLLSFVYINSNGILFIIILM